MICNNEITIRPTFLYYVQKNIHVEYRTKNYKLVLRLLIFFLNNFKVKIWTKVYVQCIVYT